MSCTDTTPEQDKAIENAAACAGDYLDSIGKTDLADLTIEEWEQLASVYCLNYHTRLASQSVAL